MVRGELPNQNLSTSRRITRSQPKQRQWIPFYTKSIQVLTNELIQMESNHEVECDSGSENDLDDDEDDEWGSGNLSYLYGTLRFIFLCVFLKKKVLLFVI